MEFHLDAAGVWLMQRMLLCLQKVGKEVSMIGSARIANYDLQSNGLMSGSASHQHHPSQQRSVVQPSTSTGLFDQFSAATQAPTQCGSTSTSTHFQERVASPGLPAMKLVAVNAAHTSLCLMVLGESVFERINFTQQAVDHKRGIATMRIALPVRLLLRAFKNLNKVERVVLSSNPEACTFSVRLLASHGVRRTYSFVPSKAKVRYPKPVVWSRRHFIAAPAALHCSIYRHFDLVSGGGEGGERSLIREDVTIRIDDTRNGVIFETCTATPLEETADPTADRKWTANFTTLQLHQSSLQLLYADARLPSEVGVTFAIHDIRAVAAFCLSCETTLALSFRIPGCPAIFTVRVTVRTHPYTACL
eukprot:Lankesteria_metandrocarpae@DN2303_c0_g1_i2.p1